MTLLFDIGNTRIKWARDGGRQRFVTQAADVATFMRLLAGARADESVVAVNVAGQPAERALRAAVRAAGLPALRLLRSTPRVRLASGTLVNGYREPWRLGADRWAAMLGARALTGGRVALCVIDVGTAMTLDLVAADGRHRGGYIVPGPALAVESLLAGTRGIRRRATPEAGRGSATPRSTRPAIERGALEACAAMIDRTTRLARTRLGAPVRVLLTGGAAPSVLPALSVPVRHVPDLVLHGLRAWADC